MSPRTIRAHFDGQHICLDEPCQLEPDAELLVVILPKQSNDDERDDWMRISQHALASAYGDNEPEYPLDAIREPNPEYERR